MEFIALFCIIVLLSLFDASFSSAVAMMLISLSCVFFSSWTFKNNYRERALSTIIWLLIIYFISSFIISIAFKNGSGFLLQDPIGYIERYSGFHSFDKEYFLQELEFGFISFSDNNPIYNTMMAYWAYVGNELLGGGTPFYYTLIHVFWGILCAIVFYSILLDKFDSLVARKAIYAFFLLSPFFFYSCLCVRDIVISFFYLLEFKLLLSRFKVSKLLLFLLISSIIVGLRLYSGIFSLVFLALYVYLAASQTKYKLLFQIFFIFIFVVFFSGLTYLGLIEQSMEELTTYTDFSDEIAVTSGLSSKLNSLPPGLKEFAKLLYSQFSSIPPYASLLEAQTLPQVFMAILVLFFSVWWFFIFYSETVFMFFYKGFKKVSALEKYMFLIALIYILLNTTQIDVRRMMAVYPMLYYMYLSINHHIILKKEQENIRRFLIITYCFVLVIYTFLKI